jgi:phosphoenolpyruvate carboxylase
MSTQHPDNVTSPFFVASDEISGEDEVKEAYYAFSHLGCDEQMWDCEGKEVDSHVVVKLFSRYEAFFRQKRLGEDLFLTLRVPNPTVEKVEGKILLETLESIPRCLDAARLFYGEEAIPVFEVILPMTTSARCLDRIRRYYTDFIIKRQYQPFQAGDITIREWIGEFGPETIQVIPLVEDMEHMLKVHQITGEYLAGKGLTHQRVFLARSDPAMNYGLVSAVLLNKIALQRLAELSRATGVKICPIVGVGSAPFRGNLRPQTAERLRAEYPSAHTFTIQSAFKYDNPLTEVREGIRRLQEGTPGPALEMQAERCLEIIGRYCQEYQRQVVELAPVINAVARYVPSRRSRRLHIGLFGYARSLNGVALPRAIAFTAALYSLGVPPEVLGLNALTAEDVHFIREVYHNFDADLRDALAFLDPQSPFLPQEVRARVEELGIERQANAEHQELTRCISADLAANRAARLAEQVLVAAKLRCFLG